MYAGMVNREIPILIPAHVFITDLAPTAWYQPATFEETTRSATAFVNMIVTSAWFMSCVWSAFACKSLSSRFTLWIAVQDVAHGCLRAEWTGHRLQHAPEQNPCHRLFVLGCEAESYKGRCADRHRDEHEHETEFWLENSIVLFGHEFGNPVR